MSLGNKLTWYLLVGVLAVMGLDMYLSLERTRANLLDDLRREVAAISRTLWVTLEVSGDDAPERYFAQLAPGISGLENILGVVFYDRAGRVAATSASLQGRRLPEVDVQAVIRTRTPIEGLFSEGSAQRYYRVEAIPSSTGEGIAAFLVLEDFPLFTREFRDFARGRANKVIGSYGRRRVNGRQHEGRVTSELAAGDCELQPEKHPEQKEIAPVTQLATEQKRQTDQERNQHREWKLDGKKDSIKVPWHALKPGFDRVVI